MRLLRYNAAMSLDGFIADEHDAFDWIPEDDTVDFLALFQRIDTFVLGRRTLETVLAHGPPPWGGDARVYVISSTLAPDAVKGGEVVHPDKAVALASSLRHEAGDGEIWLFGGGQLFAALLAGGQVDRVELTVVPILLGAGIPVVARLPKRAPLKLVHTHVYPSGMAALHYEVPGAH